MATDTAARVLLQELVHQLSHGSLLLGRSGVLAMVSAILAFGRFATTDVADADAVGVVALHMGTYLRFGAACMDATIAIDDVVVPYLAESPRAVPSVDVLDGEVLAFGSRGAMDDN